MIHTQKQMIKILCVLLIFASLYGCKENQEPVNSGTDSATPIEANAVQYEAMEVNGHYEDDYVILNYIPEGFVLTEKTSGELRTTLNFEKESKYFTFCSKRGDSTNTFDTENAKLQKIWINQNEALLSCKDGVNVVVWYIDNKSLSLIGNIRQEEIIKIAENTQKK